MKITNFLLLLATASTILSCSVASTTAALGVSTGSSSGGKETTIINNNQTQPQQPVIIYQQPAQQPVPEVQQKTKTGNSAIRNFAVKSYSKIVNEKGQGEHLNSLILLMESEGVPKDEALTLIKRALRKSNGNAEVFGDEIENSL